MNEVSPILPAPRARKPDWIRVKAPVGKGVAEKVDPTLPGGTASRDKI